MTKTLNIPHSYNTRRHTTTERLLCFQAERLEKWIEIENGLHLFNDSHIYFRFRFPQSQVFHRTPQLFTKYFQNQKLPQCRSFCPTVQWCAKEGTLAPPVESLCSTEQPSEKPQVPWELHIYTALYQWEERQSSASQRLRSVWKCCIKELRGIMMDMGLLHLWLEKYFQVEKETNLMLRSWHPIAAYFQLGSTSMS